jgi:hypothetical protein
VHVFSQHIPNISRNEEYEVTEFNGWNPAAFLLISKPAKAWPAIGMPQQFEQFLCWNKLQVRIHQWRDLAVGLLRLH